MLPAVHTVIAVIKRSTAKVPGMVISADWMGAFGEGEKMKELVAVVFYFFYWGICFLGTGSDRKNLMGLRSYPDEVQERVRHEPQFAGAVPKAKPLPVILLSNFLLFTVVFSLLGILLKKVLELDGYWPTFWYFLALGEGLGLFDLVVIDLFWWRNTKRVRFSFLPEKSYYRNPRKHVGSFVRGIPLFAIIAVAVAGIVSAF